MASESQSEDKSMKKREDIAMQLETLIGNVTTNFEESVQLVAGAGFEPTSFERLRRIKSMRPISLGIPSTK
jgi:hypothetical protein